MSSLKNAGDLLALMREVVNVRRLKPAAEDVEAAESLLQAFSLGPSLANTQPWEVIWLQSPQEKEQVAAATLDPLMTNGSLGGQGWVAEAPLLFLFTLERRRSEGRVGRRGREIAFFDTAAAIQNLRLLAAQLRLATAVVREFDPEAMAAACALPWYAEPIALVAVGQAAHTPEQPERLPYTEILHHGKW